MDDGTLYGGIDEEEGFGKTTEEGFGRTTEGAPLEVSLTKPTPYYYTLLAGA